MDACLDLAHITFCCETCTPWAASSSAFRGLRAHQQPHALYICIFTHFENIFDLVYFFLAPDSCVRLQRCGDRTPQQCCNTHTDSCARNLLASWMHALTFHTSPSAAKRAPQGQLATRLFVDLEHTNTHMHDTYAYSHTLRTSLVWCTFSWPAIHVCSFNFVETEHHSNAATQIPTHVSVIF